MAIDGSHGHGFAESVFVFGVYPYPSIDGEGRTDDGMAAGMQGPVGVVPVVGAPQMAQYAVAHDNSQQVHTNINGMVPIMVSQDQAGVPMWRSQTTGGIWQDASTAYGRSDMMGQTTWTGFNHEQYNVSQQQMGQAGSVNDFAQAQEQEDWWAMDSTAAKLTDDLVGNPELASANAANIWDSRSKPRSSPKKQPNSRSEANATEEVKERDYKDEHEVLDFISLASGPAPQPPSQEEEQQIFGDLLFLRAWPICCGAVDTDEAPKLCGKAVGMLLRQPRAVILDLLVSGSAKDFRSKIRETLKAVGATLKASKTEASAVNGGGSASAAEIPPIPGGGPPKERHGDLLYVLVAAIVEDARLAAKICGMLLEDASKHGADVIRSFLEDDKKLRNALKNALRTLETQQREEREARQMLPEFCAVAPAERGHFLIKKAEGDRSNVVGMGAQHGAAAGEASAVDPAKTKAYAAFMLKVALKHTSNPGVVAHKIARAMGAVQIGANAKLYELFEQCGISRSELVGYGMKSGKGGKGAGGRGDQGGASAFGDRKTAKSPQRWRSARSPQPTGGAVGGNSGGQNAPSQGHAPSGYIGLGGRSRGLDGKWQGAPQAAELSNSSTAAGRRTRSRPSRPVEDPSGCHGGDGSKTTTTPFARQVGGAREASNTQNNIATPSDDLSKVPTTRTGRNEPWVRNKAAPDPNGGEGSQATSGNAAPSAQLAPGLLSIRLPSDKKGPPSIAEPYRGRADVADGAPEHVGECNAQSTGRLLAQLGEELEAPSSSSLPEPQLPDLEKAPLPGQRPVPGLFRVPQHVAENIRHKEDVPRGGRSPPPRIRPARTVNDDDEEEAHHRQRLEADVDRELTRELAGSRKREVPPWRSAAVRAEATAGTSEGSRAEGTYGRSQGEERSVASRPAVAASTREAFKVEEAQRSRQGEERQPKPTQSKQQPRDEYPALQSTDTTRTRSSSASKPVDSGSRIRDSSGSRPKRRQWKHIVDAFDDAHTELESVRPRSLEPSEMQANKIARPAATRLRGASSDRLVLSSSSSIKKLPVSAEEVMPKQDTSEKRTPWGTQLPTAQSRGRDLLPVRREPEVLEAIPEAGKKKKSVQVDDIVSRVEPERLEAGKKKKRQWTPLSEIIDLPGSSRSKSTEPVISGGKDRGSDKKASNVQKDAAQEVMEATEMKERLRSIAEEKLRAVEQEDFDLAATLKKEESLLRQSMEKLEKKAVATGVAKKDEFKSWAERLASQDQGAGSRWRRAASAEPQPSAAAAVAAQTAGASQGSAGLPTSSSGAKGGLVFFLTAPGELDPDTFKPFATHVARRDALARIASAALWRGRGQPWEDVREVIFLFEDQSLLRIHPRFVSSCPVPSEYHLVQVLSRALERGGALGLRTESAELGVRASQKLGGVRGTGAAAALAGQVERVIGAYAADSQTAAVLLHESYPQHLNIHNTPSEQERREDENRTLIFFLGAVRDMSNEETGAVLRGCRAHDVPYIEANLGQQAEFTSKIIDVLQGHNLHRRLMPAAWRCAKRFGGIARDIPEPGQVSTHRPPKGTFWVLVPLGGGPRDIASDDQKRDGVYEVPRCLISQLWCSKNEHSGHIISFVFAGGEVITAYPSLVSCMKLQHRAAPTERNLVNALRVGFGDFQADPTLTVDKGCVTLRKDAADLAQDAALTDLITDGSRAMIVDLQLDSESSANGAPRLAPYANENENTSYRGCRDVVVLLRQAGSRDFPKGFREKLSATVHREGGVKKSAPKLLSLSLPKLSINAGISFLGHFWQTGTLAPALAASAANTQV